MERALQIEQAGAIAWIWLNRPDVHNAFDAGIIAELTAAFEDYAHRPDVRAIVLAGRGKSFSAGAQVQWMKEQGAASVDENAKDARKLANLFRAIAEAPKPTLARVHGAAMGGGVGLAAACDIAIGSSTAIFAMSEVRLGLVPATIAPYVVRAIGERHARRLFQTGERIDAVTAQRIGLLHEVAPPEELDARIATVIDAILMGAPLAQVAAKDLVEAVANKPINEEVVQETALRISLCRAKPEAVEGLSAFLEKRTPSWAPQGK